MKKIITPVISCLPSWESQNEPDWLLAKILLRLLISVYIIHTENNGQQDWYNWEDEECVL